MRIDELTQSIKAKQTRRVGRGPGSGRGKTAGRGTKGSKARTGGSIPAHFEGGQTPFSRRMPKRKGFHPPQKPKVFIINLHQLSKLLIDGKLTIDALIKQGWLSEDSQLKILGDGEVNQIINITTHQISKSARQKIEAAGGQVTIINK